MLIVWYVAFQNGFYAHINVQTLQLALTDWQVYSREGGQVAQALHLLLLSVQIPASLPCRATYLPHCVLMQSSA